MRTPAAALAALLALALSACGSPCQDLGDRICDCQPQGTSRDSCRSTVRSTLSANSPNGAQEDTCRHLLDTCKAPDSSNVCDFINSEAGKEACGMAFPVPP
ncbi:MAG TPA: hypothetical protein VFP65_27070 [Anaeromyxobacteraceae bacterium]|nr:hypothetical protein [Anaeromyxobacteraceae bacterium]